MVFIYGIFYDYGLRFQLFNRVKYQLTDFFAFIELNTLAFIDSKMLKNPPQFSMECHIYRVTGWDQTENT